MKIGIFVSSQIRNSYRQIKTNLNLLHDAFENSEFVFGVWSYEKDKLEELKYFTDKILIIDEPHIDYEPYLDNPDVMQNWNYQKKIKTPNERHKHQTKQILCHNELVKKYGKHYDVIIRARWDTTISPIIDFMPFVKETYEEPCVVAISTRKDYQTEIMSIGENSSWKFPFLNHRNEITGKVKQSATCKMLLDNGILMHRYEDWNSSLVEQLHDDKKLLAAEFGWYQILVEGTSHQKWIHYDGGACITRTLTQKDREIIKKYESLCNYNH